MRFGYVTLIAFAAWGSLSSCTHEETSVSRTDRLLTVSGPRVSVERFVASQGSLRPPRSSSSIQTLADGRAKATVSIPIGHAGVDVVHTAKEALAAGLSYTFVDRRTTVTTRS